MADLLSDYHEGLATEFLQDIKSRLDKVKVEGLKQISPDDDLTRGESIHVATINFEDIGEHVPEKHYMDQNARTPGISLGPFLHIDPIGEHVPEKHYMDQNARTPPTIWIVRCSLYLDRLFGHLP